MQNRFLIAVVETKPRKEERRIIKDKNNQWWSIWPTIGKIDKPKFVEFIEDGIPLFEAKEAK